MKKQLKRFKNFQKLFIIPSIIYMLDKQIEKIKKDRKKSRRRLYKINKKLKSL